MDMTMLQAVVIHARRNESRYYGCECVSTTNRARWRNSPGLSLLTRRTFRRSGTNASWEKLHIGEAYLAFQIETSGNEHPDAILQSIREQGYDVERINPELESTY